MTAPSLPWRSLRLTTLAGNFLGAILSFFYFRVVDPETAAAAGAVRVREVVVSVAVFGVLAGIGYGLGRRWLNPLVSTARDDEAALGPVVRHRALLVPYVFACLTLAGWVLAGLIWGVVWPTVTGGGFNPQLSLRLFFGITGIAGSVATVFSFLAAEHYWRCAMPVFFPRGDVSLVPSALRLPVRFRLLGIFLLISVIPLIILGTLAYNRAQALLHVDPERAAVLVGSLGPLILFIVAVGILAAIGLALFAANSVAAPLKQVEEAMAAVGGGELGTTCPVVANDEIGAVAEGFNRMLEGLRERERIRETFGRYVASEVRDEILAGRASFEGRMEEVTILFADLRDFTPWVERTGPREVVRDLNEYFTEMEAAIRSQRGLVLQYIGDEIEAVFGAPLPAPDQADRALAAALEMRSRLRQLNARRAEAGKPPLRNGIGIHTGTVLAGSIGSAERTTYALVGDAVNLASRIQGLNKELGTEILVSEATRRRLTTAPALSALPAVRVKGKSVEVSVYRAD
jgi:class 3 adenylate cyclase